MSLYLPLILIAYVHQLALHNCLSAKFDVNSDTKK